MTDRLALRSVVRFLGLATVLNGLAYLLLLALVVAIAGKTGGSVDPVVAALIGGATALVTTPAAALGTLLLAPSLTRPSSEPQEVVVRQPAGDPVPVDDGTAGHAVVALLLLMGGALLFIFGLAAAVTGRVELLEVAFALVGVVLCGIGLEHV